MIHTLVSGCEGKWSEKKWLVVASDFSNHFLLRAGTLEWNDIRKYKRLDNEGGNNPR